MERSKIKKSAKKFWTDFQKFITRGNVVDLAVAVVVGGGFTKIVNSLVNDIIMPLITGLVGNVSVQDLKWVIVEATETKVEVAVMYGTFLQTILNFLIISFFIFITLKIFAKAKDVTEDLSKKIIKKNNHNEDNIETPTCDSNQLNKKEKIVNNSKQEMPVENDKKNVELEQNNETNILLKQIVDLLAKKE